MNEAADRAGSRAATRSNSLLVNVAALLQEPIGSLRNVDVDGAICAPLGSNATLSGDLRLLRTDQSILATAQLSTVVIEICGGCLDPMEASVEIAFDEEFWPAADPVSGLRLEPPPEREGFAVVDAQIDLTEAVRQYVEMARPMSPRCGSSCPGLADAAPDREREPDARWAALAALRKELGE